MWRRLLIVWYRIQGCSPVQAEWRAKRAMERPAQTRDAIEAGAERARDERFHCACGQLLVRGDTECPQCGRRQFMPSQLRVWGRLLRSLLPEEFLGTKVVAGLIMLGYLVQLSYGGGGLMSPNGDVEFFELGWSFPGLTNGAQPWRGFTYTLLHGGLMHIAFNVYALFQVGPLVERVFGTARFLFGYILAGFLAALIPLWLGINNPVVGASGSVFGLIGMALIFGHKVGTTEGKALRDIMIRWTIYCTIFGVLLGGVAHGAHFGGLATGIVVGLVFPPPGRLAERRRLSPILGFAAVAAGMGSLILFVLWFSGPRMPDESVPLEVRAHWYGRLVKERGIEVILQPHEISLLKEARRIRRDGAAPAELQMLESKAKRLIGTMDPAKQYFFAKEIVDRVDLNAGGIREP